MAGDGVGDLTYIEFMTDNAPAFLPPRPIIRFAWKLHKALYRFSGGRFGLQEYTPHKEGLAELTTIGRKSGQPRAVMIAYLEDDNDYVTIAMNGWDVADPAWWLNLQANDQAKLALPSGTIDVVGRAATAGAEHDRLWRRWRELDKHVDRQSMRRTNGTPVIILSPVRANQSA